MIGMLLSAIKNQFSLGLMPGTRKERKRQRELERQYQALKRRAPFSREIPAVSIDVILEDHANLVKLIFRASGVRQAIFDSTYMEMIRRYAAFVHLLPASRDSHHVHPGGLFKHGLEVGLTALRLCKERRFVPLSVYPAKAIEAEPMWRLAVFACGLAHDLGKVISSMRVATAKGNIWSPWANDVTTWANEQGVYHYHVHWLSSKNEEHESITSMLINRIVGQEILGSIAEKTGDQATKEMSYALVGKHDPDNRIIDIVMRADSLSATESNRRLKTEASVFEPTTPQHKLVVDIIRRSIKGDADGAAWKPNIHGAVIYNTTMGVFIKWGEAARQIARNLSGEDDAKGMLLDADSIADQLIEEGIAEPYVDGKGVRHRYWRVCVEPIAESRKQRKLVATSVPLKVLKITHAEMIWDEGLPNTITASLAQEKPPEPVSNVSKSDPDKEAGQSASEKGATISQLSQPAIPEEPPMPEPPPYLSEAPASIDAPPSARANEVVVPPKSEANETNSAPQALMDKKPIEGVSAKKTIEKKKSPETEDPVADANAFFDDLEDADFLISLASFFGAGKKQWGKDAVRTENGVIYLAHPDGWEGTGGDRQSSMLFMRRSNIILPRPDNANAFVHEATFAGKKRKALMLSDEASRHFFVLAEQASQADVADDANRASSNKKAKPTVKNKKEPTSQPASHSMDRNPNPPAGKDPEKGAQRKNHVDASPIEVVQGSQTTEKLESAPKKTDGQDRKRSLSGKPESEEVQPVPDIAELTTVQSSAFEIESLLEDLPDDLVIRKTNSGNRVVNILQLKEHLESVTNWKKSHLQKALMKVDRLEYIEDGNVVVKEKKRA
jgi:hypothetical protein